MTTESEAKPMEIVHELCRACGVDPHEVLHIGVEPWGITFEMYEKDDGEFVLDEHQLPIRTRKHVPMSQDVAGSR